MCSSVDAPVILVGGEIGGEVDLPDLDLHAMTFSCPHPNNHWGGGWWQCWRVWSTKPRCRDKRTFSSGRL